MYHKELTTKFPDEILPEDELGLYGLHFNNKILVQIRYNGEMDSTFEVLPRGLEPLPMPLAGDNFTDTDDYSTTDHMSDWQVVCRLGDSNDAQLPVICTQIGELYRTVILPSNVDGMCQKDKIQCRGLVITMSTKMWKDTEKNFDKLVFLLGNLKRMYNN